MPSSAGLSAEVLLVALTRESFPGKPRVASLPAMTAAFPELRPAPQPSRPGPLSILLRLALGLLALAIPLFAVWVTTSLLLSTGAPLALALPLGIALPLALPIVWDFWAEARYRRHQNPPARILARSDRIRLRVLAVCLAVIGIAVLAIGKTSGNALASHGRWILFGARGPFAVDVPHGIEGLAGSIAGITGGSIEHVAQAPSPLPQPVAPAPLPSAPVPSAAPQPGQVSWPLPATPHPVISGMADADITSIDAVAERIRSREVDPFQRVKAVHDFVTRWVAYDGQALRKDYEVPPQDADATFARRTGTCDGYVQLMVALGGKLDIEMTRILGRSRATGTSADGFYHSWVGVTIGGQPYLVDPTWDAGSLFGHEYRPRYSTSYLFTPPEIFAYDHLPNDDAWSLTEPPLTEALFVERPTLSAHFFAWGLALEGVTKAVSETTTGRFDFRIRNPKGAWVLVLAQPIDPSTGRAIPSTDSQKTFNCVVPSQANPIEAGCALSPGSWQLEIYANNAAGGRFPAMGFLRVEAKAP